jgi:uncharacterized RDD family membrane protein YckC
VAITDYPYSDRTVGEEKETTMDISSSSTPPEPVGPNGISFGPRALAYIVDYVIILVLGFFSGLVVGWLIGWVATVVGRERATIGEGDFVITFLIGLVVVILYFALFEWLYGASPGKPVLKMRVVQSNGDPCDFKSALIRGVCRLVDG